MKNVLKRTLAIFLAVVMTIGVAPLSGYVGLKLPEIKIPEFNLGNIKIPKFSLPEISLTDLFDFSVKPKAAELPSDFELEKYNVQVIFGSTYGGGAPYRDFLEGVTDFSCVAPVYNAYAENSEFINSVNAYEAAKATANPSDLLNSMNLQQQYEAIIYTVLNSALNNNDYQEIKVTQSLSKYTGLTKQLANASSTAELLDKTSLTASDAKELRDTAMTFLTDGKNASSKWSAFGEYTEIVDKYAGIADKCLDGVTDAANILSTALMFTELMDSGAEVITFLQDLKSYSPNSTFTNAVNNVIKVVSNNWLGSIDSSIANAGYVVGRRVVSYMFDDVWNAWCASNPLLYGIALGGAIGTVVSNILFATDDTIAQFETLKILYLLEKASCSVFNLYGNRCSSSVTEARAESFLFATDFVYSVFSEGAEAAIKMADIALNKGLINGIVDLFTGKKITDFDRFQKLVNDRANLTNLNHMTIKNYWQYCIEADYPEFFEEVGGTVQGSSNYVDEEVQYIDFIFGDNHTMFMGQTCSVYAIAYPTGFEGRIITYTSLDESIATVSDGGWVTPVSSGTVQIKASVENGVSAICTVTILPFEVSESDNGYTITKYVGNGGDVEIPYHINYKPVTAIGSNAFENCTSITSVIIPDSVRFIDKYAFYNCTGLINLIMPVSTRIYNSSSTFGNCTNIEKVTLTKGTGTMLDCGTDKWYGSKIVYYGYTPWNISDCSEIVLEDGVENIGSYVFKSCGGLEVFTIPDSVISIGNFAFSGCRSLKSIEIPNSVISIGDNAFQSCNLTSLTIGNGITSIGVDAFSNAWIYGGEIHDVYYSGSIASWCNISFGSDLANPISCYHDSGYVYYPCNFYIDSVLQSDIVIPKIVTEIKKYTFFGYDNLNSITIPDSVVDIGEAAFEKCFMLSKVFYEGDISSWCGISFNSSSSNPMTYAYDLHIDDVLLEGNVIIPDTVTEIKNYTFLKCQDITCVTIPDSVLCIGDYAFYGCYQLDDVIIGNSVTSIGSYAFSCSSITSITIPAATTNIGRHMFLDSGILSIKVDESNPNYSNDEHGVLYNKDKTTLIQYPNSKGGSYVIRESVTNIGSDAFYGCSDLVAVLIPTSVKNIGSGAFYNCSCSLLYTGTKECWDQVSDLSIKHYNVADLITTNVGLTFSLDETSAFLIDYPDTMKEVKIPAECDGKPVVGFLCVFSDNTTITSVVFPDSITNCPRRMFYGCTNLTSVTLGNGVTNIGAEAFCYCNKLTSIVIPDSVKNIGYRAFDECMSLESVNIPESVESIGSMAFRNCSSLTTIKIPDNVKLVEDEVFLGCKNLETVVVGDGVEYIDNRAFFECYKVKELTIPVSAEQYNSSYVFCDTSLYSYLNKVTFSKGTGVMNDYAIDKNDTKLVYYGCTPWNTSKNTLKEIVIEDGVTYIGENAFRTISGFTKITIPNSVTKIGDYAFRGCTSLTDVYFGGTEEEWNEIDFGASNTSLTNATIHFLGEETGGENEPDVDEDETTKVELDLSLVKLLRGTASIKSYKGKSYVAITMTAGKTVTGIYKDMTDGGTVELVDISGTIQDRANDYVAYQSQNKTNPTATMKVTYADGTVETYPVVFELYEMEREVDLDISKNIRPIRGKASLAEDAKGEYILVEMLEGQSSVGVYKTSLDSTTATLDDAEGMFTEKENLYIFYGSQNTTNPEGRLTVTEADGSQKTYRIVFKMYEMDPYVNAAKGLRPVRGSVTFDDDGTIRIKMTSGQKSVGLYKTMANGATFKIVDENGRITNNPSSLMFYMSRNTANVTARIIFTLPDGTTKEQKIIFDMGLADNPDPLVYLSAVRGTVSYQNDGTEDYIEVKANALSSGVGLYKDCLVKYTITDVDGIMTENDTRYYIYKSQNPEVVTANINFLQSDDSYKTYKVKFVF